MKHLALLYTHNQIASQVLQLVVECFTKMVDQKALWVDTMGIIVSVHPVSVPLSQASKRIKNILAPQPIVNRGHLSIIEKIAFALQQFPADYVSLHEHDMLYPADYLLSIHEVIEETGTEFDYIAYSNLMGVNKTGYQKRLLKDFPFSTLTFSSHILNNLLVHKRNEFFKNGQWCYLEPGYGGSYGHHLRRLQLMSDTPCVHINMNQTVSNHHFTNHYLTYEPTSSSGFSEWPGDLANLFA